MKCTPNCIYRCKDEDKEESPFSVYKCTDNTALTRALVEESKANGKCACQSGGKAVCKDTNEPPKCPNNEEPSADALLPVLVRNC